MIAISAIRRCWKKGFMARLPLRRAENNSCDCRNYGRVDDIVPKRRNRDNSATAAVPGEARQDKQKRHLPEGSGVFLIMKSLKRKSLSLAGLAATYSPRA